jgi:hypothetical protein
MDNDRRKIELLNSILFTMPGTPIIYYGDEIGMGDNIYLGDRDGVRTPMQWSPDRNAGFSRAEPQRLYLPVITDSVYGFQAINVEAQQRSPFSLLNWMKRLIQVRKAAPRVRPRHDRVPAAGEPARAGVPARVRGRRDPGGEQPVGERAGGAARPVAASPARSGGAARADGVPADRRDAVRADAGPYGFFWFGLRRRAPGEDEELRTDRASGRSRSWRSSRAPTR